MKTDRYQHYKCHYPQSITPHCLHLPCYMHKQQITGLQQTHSFQCCLPPLIDTGSGYNKHVHFHAAFHHSLTLAPVSPTVNVSVLHNCPNCPQQRPRHSLQQNEADRMTVLQTAAALQQTHKGESCK